jgi:hypothetical protein
MGKTVLAFSAVLLLLVLIAFRLHSDAGPMTMERVRTNVGQAMSWTAESTSQPESPNFITFTNRTKVSCPDDYESSSRSRTRDDVIHEQSTIHIHGVTYVEDVDGKWGQNASADVTGFRLECGKGPAFLQQALGNAIIELPRRKAGKMVKGRLQTIDGVTCQELRFDFGNEWPQINAFTICIDTRTHLPRRLQYDYPAATIDFTGWNTTTIEPPQP